TGVRVVLMPWSQFCTARARPDHAVPAISATAKKVNPLCHMVRTRQDRTRGTAVHAHAYGSTDNRTRKHPEMTASHRTGRNRSPVRSERNPSSSRPAAPGIWAIATTTPAAGAPPSLFLHQVDDRVGHQGDLGHTEEHAHPVHPPDGPVTIRRAGPGGLGLCLLLPSGGTHRGRGGLGHDQDERQGQQGK